jgi:hypothetical protein
VPRQEQTRVSIVASGRQVFDFVPIGPGLAVRRTFTVQIDNPAWPLIELDIRMEQGHPVLGRVEYRRRGDNPMHIRELRTIPLRKLMDLAVRFTAVRVEETSPSNFKLTPDVSDQQDVWIGEVIRGQPPSEKALRARARKLFEQAKKEKRKNAAGWVANQIGRDRATVYRWIKEGEGGGTR